MLCAVDSYNYMLSILQKDFPDSNYSEVDINIFFFTKSPKFHIGLLKKQPNKQTSGKFESMLDRNHLEINTHYRHF